MIGARIGLCEDDADLRSVLIRALRVENFEVRATLTGHEAVESFSSNAPDLRVLDSGLPDADAEYAGLSVIFRVKPCDPEDLIALVKSALNVRASA